MNRALLASTAVALLWSAGPVLGQQSQNPQQQQTQQQSQLSQQDRQFVQQAGISNQFEIQAAEIAKNKAGIQPIQQFAQRMIDDHQKVGDQLSKIVKPLNVQVSKQLDDQHRQQIEKLKGLSGDQFASTYIQGQIDAHRQAISLFEKESNNGQNQELKQFASDTLPTLNDHLRSAQDLSQRNLTASASTSNQSTGASGQSGQQQASNQQGNGADIQVRQPPANVTVQQPPPQITVEQPKPEVTVQQAKPDVTVLQPGQPQVNVQQQSGQTQSGQQQATAQRAMSGARAEKLIGTNAVTANGDDIGEIENLLVEPSGEVKAVIIEWGGFLGIGESRAAVPWSEVQLNEVGDRVIVNMTRNEMEAMPKYDPEQPSVAGLDSDVRPFR